MFCNQYQINIIIHIFTNISIQHKTLKKRCKDIAMLNIEV